MSRFEAAREAALRFGVPLDEDPKEYPPERLLMASSDAEEWCRDAPPEQTLGYMVNARRRLEGYICHLTDIIDTMTRALELAADDARCSRCAKLGTEGCKAYDAYPRSIRRDTEEASPPDGDGHPDPPDGCGADLKDINVPGKIRFFIPENERIPTRLRLKVGGTVVRYRECENGYLFDVYTRSEPEAEQIVRRVSRLFERQSDDGCFRLVCTGRQLVLRTLIFWEYKATFSFEMDAGDGLKGRRSNDRRGE